MPPHFRHHFKFDHAMADQTQATTAGQTALTIEVTPTRVDAGAEFGLSARAICTPPCDITGLFATIRDADGKDLGQIEFTSFDGNANSSQDLKLTAPTAVGTHDWTAVLPTFDARDATYPEVTTPIALEVRAHPITVTSWGLASALTDGSTAKMHVGVRCSCGCSMAGRQVTIHDHTGAQIGAATLGDGLWPKTEALYFAEVEFPAAGEVGLHDWQIRFAGAGLEPAHGDGTANFGVRIVPPAEHVVKVEALDRDKQTPLAGALVTMHPFRGTTNEHGIAELRVPKGSYRLFVSARRYVSNHTQLEVNGDVATQAQLDIEIRPERA